MSEIADEMVALAANARRERLRDSGPCTPDVQHDVEASAMRAALDAIARCHPLNMAELCRLARLGIEAERAGAAAQQFAIAEMQRQRQETENG